MMSYCCNTQTNSYCEASYYLEHDIFIEFYSHLVVIREDALPKKERDEKFVMIAEKYNRMRYFHRVKNILEYLVVI